jgi:hypothetical protein
MLAMFLPALLHTTGRATVCGMVATVRSRQFVERISARNARTKMAHGAEAVKIGEDQDSPGGARGFGFPPLCRAVKGLPEMGRFCPSAADLGREQIL